MSLHAQRTHPVPVDGCFGCKVGTLHISPAAMAARVESNPSYRLAKGIDAEGKADRAAYRRLRREGLQPPHIRGSAKLEAHADHPYEIATGTLYSGKEGRQLKEAFAFCEDGGMNPMKAATTAKEWNDDDHGG